MSKVFKEIRFIEIYLLIVGRCGIIATIFMAEDTTLRVRTLHVDTKYHFIIENIKSECIEITWSNQAMMKLIFPKNVRKEACERHASKYLGNADDDSI
jgi:hypothetical protein